MCLYFKVLLIIEVDDIFKRNLIMIGSIPLKNFWNSNAPTDGLIKLVQVQSLGNQLDY